MNNRVDLSPGAALPGPSSHDRGDDRRRRAAAAQRCVRILFLGANPRSSDRRRELPPLSIRGEADRIQHHLLSAGQGIRVELTATLAARFDDMRRSLLVHRPHVLHVSGHGATGGGIELEDDRGESRPVTALVVADLLRILRRDLRLVVFNACNSLGLAEACSVYVDCAVGMREPIRDNEAIAFAGPLYEALGQGESVGRAFELATNALRERCLRDDVPRLVYRPEIDPWTLELTGAGTSTPVGGVLPPQAHPDSVPQAAAGSHSLILLEADTPDLYRLRELLRREVGLDAGASIEIVERARAGESPKIADGFDGARCLEIIRALARLGALATTAWPDTARGLYGSPQLPHISRVSNELAPGGLLLAYIPGADDEGIRPFLLGCEPVTQGLYRSVMGSCPASFRGDRLPAEGVSWEDARRFCQLLSERDPRHPPYRLPTIDEWEHAARAREVFRYPGAASWQEVAWARTTATRPVRWKAPNAWGLFDMAGNVWEWVEVGASEPVLKGGCCTSTERDLLIAAGPRAASDRPQHTGLRIARDIRSGESFMQRGGPR